MAQLKYKDMTVSPSSDMGKAMQERGTKPAQIEQMYQEGNKQFHAQFPKDVWDRVKANAI